MAAGLRAIAIGAVILMAPLTFYFTTEATWDLARQRNDGGWSGGYYLAQAEAIMHGRLDVARHEIRSECWDRDGKCYGYFGVTPSIIRIPVLGILRHLDSSLTPLFSGAAVLLAYWAALTLVRRSLLEFAHPGESPTLVRGYLIFAALALGPGGTLVFLTRPAVYEEAAAWALAFFFLAVDRVWAWHRTGRTRSLTAAVILAVLAANARPTGATACGVLGVAAIALWWAKRRKFVAGSGEPAFCSTRAIVAAICLALLPGVTTGGVFWLKFRTPTPDLTLNEQVPEAAHWRDLLARNGYKTKGLEFIPTEVVAYLRPDAFRRRTLWPYFDFPYPRNPVWWLPPLVPEGAYVERHTTLTATMPLPWLLNFAVIGCLVAGARSVKLGPDERTESWIFAAGIMLSAIAMVALTVTTVGITNRYLSDFFGISAVGLMLGHGLVLPWLRGRPILAIMAGLLALAATAWSILITVSLNTRLVFM